MKFYFTNYENKNVADLSDLLDGSDAELADVRFQPNSGILKWRKNYLELLLKHHYHHVPQLGNRAESRDKIQIQNLELGIRLIESWRKNVLIFCDCKENADSHCSVIKKQLENRGQETLKIVEWKKGKN